MQDQIAKYFKNKKLIFLSERPELSWKEAQKVVPSLTKSWFELSKLGAAIRLEFIHDYWIKTFPYSPQLYGFIDRFFAGVKEVGMIAVNEAVYLTYCVGKDFFFGRAPLVDREIAKLTEEIDFPFPEDFLKFYLIHNGFFRGGDRGVFSSTVLKTEAQRLKSFDEHLLPFYHSLRLDAYQCFCRDWRPDVGIGNVFYSLSDSRKEAKRGFPSFTEWLIDYLDG